MHEKPTDREKDERLGYGKGTDREREDRLGYGGEEGTSAPGAAGREEAVHDVRVSGRSVPESIPELPDSYGVDRAVALVRDPYWIHVYWELTERTLSSAARQLGGAVKGARTALRVYCSGADSAESQRVLFDIILTLEARNWYINVAFPGRTYRVDIGLLTLDGRFLRLVRSNPVTTPPDRMSDVLDEEWRSLSSEYEEMYILSGGLARGSGSSELHRRLVRRLEIGLASPLFSWGLPESGKESRR
jgi:hypothetical protein